MPPPSHGLASRLTVLAFVFGPLVPHDCDLGCSGPSRAERRAQEADRAKVHDAVSRRLAAGPLELVDPRDGRLITIQVPTVGMVFTPEGDHAIHCADGEAREKQERAWLCFTLARRAEDFELVDIAVREIGPTTAPLAKQMRHSCPRHPSFQSHEPRACPICGERLEPMKHCPDGSRVPPSGWCTPSAGSAGPKVAEDAGN
jgi:hypothetical protein